MSNFSLDLSAYLAKAKGNLDAVVQTIVQEVGASLVEMSPVGKRELWAVNIDRAGRGLPPVPPGYVGGRFRANWQASINTPSSSQFDDIDPSGQVSIDRIRNVATTANSAAGQTFYIMNNLPYAQRLENGWSQQAPSGMVGITVVRWRGILLDAVQSVRSK